MGRGLHSETIPKKKAIAANRARQRHQKFEGQHKVRDRRSGSDIALLALEDHLPEDIKLQHAEGH